MKEVKAFIQPIKLSAVTKALQDIPGFPGMTVSKCRGFGKEKGKDSPHRVIEDLIDYVAKARIEVMLRDELVDSVVEAITKTAHTGNPATARSLSTI